MKYLIDDLDAIPEFFTEGYRGILLLRRNKDGESGNSQRKSIKRISRSTNEWKLIVHELKEMQETSHQGYRIYATVNSRDMNKAIREFKRRQLDADYDHEVLKDLFYSDIENRFFSCFMHESCRFQKNFLFDCDSDEEYRQTIVKLDDSLILSEYATKNGMHIITRPFNITVDYPIIKKIEIKKDGLLFIG